MVKSKVDLKMMKVKVSLILTGIFILGCILANAGEYHVSVNGSNDAAGSAAHPFKTISSAAAIAQPGDIITIHEGTYREWVNPPRGGLSNERRIVYRAAKGEKVVIKGSEVIKGWTKLKNDTWIVNLPNTYFNNFNPYADVISGDWFNSNNRTHHTGAVYVNGHWLNEAARKEEVLEPGAGTPLWFATVNDYETIIWAQFKNANPNNDLVEINVRQSVFYPNKEGINYITVSGFKLEQAATPWAPPNAEQIGLIGPHWSKGWIIENNEVCYSVCSGISLGKYGNESDKKAATVEGFIGSINRALEHGWSKETTGGHIVRNNHIHDCEQAGIVGSLGAVFSTITGNEIHDIHVKRLFSGMEMAGIKIHGAIDILISHNYVHHCWRGIWLDWMAQGTRLTGNLLYDNIATQDIFVEVNHGPLLIDNNILLSPNAIRDLSQGTAIVHNLFIGSFIPQTDTRVTPYQFEHSTNIAGFKVIKSGDDRYYNNIFMSNDKEAPWPERNGPRQEGNFFGLGAYKSIDFPMVADGNVYVDEAKAFESEKNPVVNADFKTYARIITNEEGVFLKIKIDKDWLKKQRKLITTKLLGKTENQDLPFVQPDGTPYFLDTDYSGKSRNLKNPSPGPFATVIEGIMIIRVWNR
jgi:alpha-N-arabinofuranosidase